MSQLFLSAGVFPWVILEVGGDVMRVVCGHRGVLTSPGPAGAADCGYGFADIIVLPLHNGKSWQLTSCASRFTFQQRLNSSSLKCSSRIHHIISTTI